MPAELLKKGGEEVTKVFHQLVLHIWNSETISQALLERAVIALHKEGDKLDCENYSQRGLQSFCESAVQQTSSVC